MTFSAEINEIRILLEVILEGYSCSKQEDFTEKIDLNIYV